MSEENLDNNVLQEEGQEVCPSCGYFVGAAATCVRCGARTQKKIAVKLVRQIALIGSVVGVVLLYIAAYTKQPQEVRISDIDELMNGALVKVVGNVSSFRADEEKNSLRLKIDDGTGELSANAFNKLSHFRDILGENMPGVGDKIEVTGTLNVTQKFGVSMFLTVPDRIVILKKFKLKVVDIGDLTKDSSGALVVLHCYVADYEQIRTRSGAVLHKFTLKDKTGEIETVIFETAFDKLPENTKKFLLKGGYKLEILVKISVYRDKLQADIINPERIKKLGRTKKRLKRKKHRKSKKYASSKGPNTFGNLKDSDKGSKYDFEATVKYIDKKSKGTLVTLDDGTGRMKIMVWDNIQDRIKGFPDIMRGDKIKGTFLVSDYKGRLNLKITRPESVRVITE